MQATGEGPYVPPELQRSRRKSRWMAPAAIGLVIGATMGFAGGYGLASAASSGSGLDEKAIAAAVESCGMDEAGYRILDGGKAIQLDTKGEDSGDAGTENYLAYYCMLNELGVPETTQHKMDRTRALDGTQTDSWEGHKASWSYHPDNGVHVLIEGADKK
ncbi:hypothetical protein OK351_09040 [Glutamicibacter sp. MNS18]|uniref:hypothetical protein n=1 Tax=Glutamicibacter sp. MNS18 TaxID=2989817 RepID=UPI0022357086|nr:hypothetical protein [Glutamicibacter sp. MNS18]MCW4465650.1 hypothetical protein [Glutamicibacter sp. MNS18]